MLDSRAAVERMQVSADDAAAKTRAFDAVVSALNTLGGSSAPPRSDIALFWVPGRIEFLGKHTDYAGGRSLLCTVERGICLAARRRTDSLVRVHDAAMGARMGATIDCALDPALVAPAGQWGNYPMTVVRRIARNFPSARTGVDIAFRNDLPIAAGISSSSALVVACFLALSDANDLPALPAYRENIRSPEHLAEFIGCIEAGLGFGTLAGDRGVGTLSGCEDQTAMICGRPNALVQYSFCPVRAEGVAPLPADLTFVIASSGVVAEKTSAALDKYNRVSRLASAAAEAWRMMSGQFSATLGDALAAADAETIRAALLRSSGSEFTPTQLAERFEQFHLESAIIIPGAAEALRRGDLVRLGECVDQSQDAGTRLLGNQIPETIALARAARELGAVAASAFGAGFGGSVWALVGRSDAGSFSSEWFARYTSEFPAHRSSARFFVTRAGVPATKLG